MKLECYNNPFLADFLNVCLRLPEDEKQQLELLTGYKFDVDGAAVGNFSAPGPKWVIKAQGVPLVVGGFSPERPGVWRDFLLTTPEAWGVHWFGVTRICRRIMDQMFLGKHAHRLECITPAMRIRPALERWYTILGYNKEAVLHGYCANGADAILYARVQH